MGFIFSKREVLDRIKHHYRLGSNADLARFLEISPSTLANWYSRNSIDFDIVFTKCDDVNWDWLVKGKESGVSYPHIEEPNILEISPHECENCKNKDVLISKLRKEMDTKNKLIKTQEKLIAYIESEKSPIKAGQKRKAAS